MCEVQISSTIPNGRIVHRGDIVTFTCIVRGSSSLAWSSPQYIGENDRVEFSVVSVTRINVPNEFVRAELVHVSTEPVNELTSTLRIEVQPSFNMLNVTCHSIGNDQSASRNFEFSGMQYIHNVCVKFL